MFLLSPGFHRPLGVIPPSSGSPHSRTPPIYHLTPPYHPHYFGSLFGEPFSPNNFWPKPPPFPLHLWLLLGQHPLPFTLFG